MYLLNEFARTVGAKDKKDRKKKALKIVGGLAVTGLVAATLLKNKGKVSKLVTKNDLKPPIPPKQKPSYRTKSDNTAIVNARKQAIQSNSLTNLDTLKQKDKRTVTKAIVNRLKKENKYFKNNSNLSLFK